MKTPEPTFIYNKAVGDLRQKNLAMVLREWGFNVITGSISTNDCDLWVNRGKQLVALIECLNWGKTSYMKSDRERRIIKNLSKTDCPKYLICSFPKNIKSTKNLDSNGVKIIYLGFQTQPKEYYAFFEAEGIAKERGMRPQSPELLNDLRVKLMELKDLQPTRELLSFKEYRRRNRD